jgi:hypothetical protein
MTYRPPKQSQFEPLTPTSSKNCVAATAAYLVERATAGRIKSDHAVIRNASGAPATRGLYIFEAQAAVAKLYGIKLDAVPFASRATLYDIVNSGRAVGVMIDCDVTVNTTRRTNSYTGLHEVYVGDVSQWPKSADVCACEKHTTSAHREYLVEDPGTTTTGYLLWSEDLLCRAAESVTGDRGINLMVAPDTEGAVRTAIGSPYARVSPSLTAKATRRLSSGQQVYATKTLNGAGGEGWMRLSAGDYVRAAYLV